MRCDFCQNYGISQIKPPDPGPVVNPEEIIFKARRSENNIGIAFTYNEPVIWFEYVRDVAELARKEGMHTIMVTNGFVTGPVLDEYLGFIDAFNVDLKAFNDDFYKSVTGAALEPVKATLKAIRRAGKHLEITTLIIPGKNDLSTEMNEEARWIAGELGNDVPLHLSRYFPMYKRSDPLTSADKLTELYEVASIYLNFVYQGNTNSGRGQDTRCPVCEQIITKRSGYNVRHMNTTNGTCLTCGRLIYSDFISSSL